MELYINNGSLFIKNRALLSIIVTFTALPNCLYAIVSVLCIIYFSGKDCNLAHSHGVKYLDLGPYIGIILVIATNVGV